ncbi:MAG: hypothetical protein GEU98_20275 [Pseudonocardiaceae bacterium]|nr:hypothetical protein [Pseudonocardiaceae bacterium]
MALGHLAGVCLIIVGGLVGAAALSGLRAWRRQYAHRFTGSIAQPTGTDTPRYVLAHDGPDAGHSLPLGAPLATSIAPGDTLEMYTSAGNPGEALPLNRHAGRVAIGSVIQAALLVVAGSGVLIAPGDGGEYDSIGEIAFLIIGSVILTSLGVFGVMLVIKFGQGLAGSRRVAGTVIDTQRVSTGRTFDLHKPLVRYELDGHERQTWASPRLRRPKPGKPITVRIEGSGTREVVHSGCFVLAGMLSCWFAARSAWPCSSPWPAGPTSNRRYELLSTARSSRCSSPPGSGTNLC